MKKVLISLFLLLMFIIVSCNPAVKNKNKEEFDTDVFPDVEDVEQIFNDESEDSSQLSDQDLYDNDTTITDNDLDNDLHIILDEEPDAADVDSSINDDDSVFIDDDVQVTDHDSYECEEGDINSKECGPGGLQLLKCVSGKWENDGGCSCTSPGSIRILFCGTNGTQKQNCTAGEWVNEGACVEKLADPVFNIPAGTYQTAQSIEITHPEIGVIIRYTVDDSLDPSEGYGLVYSEPINIPADGTTETVRIIKAKAYKPGFETSNMLTKEYTVTGTVVTPQFSLAAGTYNTNQTVTITTDMTGASIRYTTDGTDPSDTFGNIYTSPVDITETTTLKAVAYKSDWLSSDVIAASYTLKPATPSFDPPSGKYNTDQSITITTSITDGVIIYTTDGNDPSETYGIVYTTPVHLQTSTLDETFPVIKAKVFKLGWSASDTGIANYNINGKVEAPTMSPAPGTYNYEQEIVLSTATVDSIIRYTTDKTEPTSSSTVYTVPIVIPSNQINETLMEIRAKAFRADWIDSDTTTGNYTVTGTVTTPQFSLTSGIYNINQIVTITTDMTGASIRYTTDGTDPSDTTGNIYTSPVDITETTTLKAVAYKADWLNSDIAAASYTLKPATPSFDPPSGKYNTDQNITITTSITDGIIIYTIDESEPSEINGIVYTIPVNLSANIIDGTFPVIKAKVFKPGWSDSDAGTANYNITGKVEAPTMSPIPGTYSSQQSITLSTVTSDAVIRYTTDKTEPNSSSTVYTVPIVIPSNQINETFREIRAKAFLTDWIDSETTTGNYTVTGTVVMPQFSLVAGTYNTDQTVTITTTTSDASIRYTTDGTDPSDTTGNIYTSPVDITATTKLKAVAYKTDWTNSSVQSSDYTMKMSDPVFSVFSGTYTTTQNITLSTLSPHSEIRYTTNGDDPDKTSTLYTGAIELPTNEIDETITTIKAKTFSIEFGWEDSGITENTYRITGTVATPVLSPVGGTYTTSKSVTITCVTNGATIRYTTNGTEPTTGSSVFTAPISLENGSITTVKTKAFRIDWVNSATGSSTYKIDNIPAPVITPDGGVFNEPVQNVMITTPINGATIRYVLDGGEPVDSSAIYSGPITFDVSRHLVAKVFKPGFTTSPKAEKGYVVGRERTTKLLGSPLNDEGHSIFVDSSGNTYITGYAGGSLDGNTYAGNSDIFLAKWNNHLEKQWVQQWGTSFSDYGTSIVADSSGNIYVTGETQSSLDGNIWNVGYSSNGIPYKDVFLTKWNNSGEKQWTKQWGTNKKDTGRSVAIDASGNIYVTGLTWGSLDGNANKGEDDVFITKWNSNGEKQWTKQWGTSNWDESNSINIDTSGNIFITGYTNGRWDGTDTVDSDIFLTKLNDAGESLWTEQVKISYYNKANSVAVDSTGNIYVLGVYKSKLDTVTDMDVFLVKWNSSGEILWIKNWGNIYYEVGNSLTIDHDDNIYIMSNGLIKLNSDGKILWTKQWGVNGTGVGTDFYGDVYVTGWMSGSIDNNTSAGYNDIFISKWSFDDYSSDLGCQLLPTPSPGTYNTPQNVLLSCSTEGSDIRFEINDPEPDMFSIPYENPIEVTETSTLKAIAYKLGVAGYSKTSPVYTIDEGLEQVAAPTFDQPNEGDNRKVIIDITIATETPGAIIKYTLDGSEPSRTNGYEYTEPVSTSAHDVLKAKAFKSGMTDSITVTADYHILYTVCTGQTLCYNDSTNMNCPGIGETFYGQDTQYGDMRYCASKSFDISGTEPEEIVIDNNTGLIWQRTFSINSNTWKSAVSYCNGLVYAGKADWRLPTRKELATLIDYGRYNPSVDTFTFPSIKSNNYWSSSFFVHDTDDAWIVDSGKGSVVNIHKNNGGQVICVRGIDWTPVGIFEESAISGEVIVKDTATGLIWQKEYSGVLTWVNALSYCENSTYAGYAEWRLPNIEELKTLIDDSIIIPGAPSTDFWSSSSYVGDIRFAWNMNLPEGQVDISVKTGQSYARCVR